MLKHLLVTLALFAAMSGAADGQREGRPPSSPPPSLAGNEVWVSGFTSNAVHRFDPRDGEVVGDPLVVPGAQSVTEAPMGLLFVVAEQTNTIWRYRGTRPVDRFVWDDPNTMVDESGGLDGPTAATIGPDGNLYVASFNTDAILRYDGSTGVYLGDFVASGEGGLDGPDAGTTFGPDGHLYVPSFNSNKILRYDGSTGEFLDLFIGLGAGKGPAGGISRPRMLLFRPTGELWVSSSGSGRLLAYDSNGVFVRRLLNLGGISGFAINPHDGNLYVTSTTSNLVRVYKATTGAFIRTLIPSGSTSLLGATYVAFVSPGK